MKNKKILSSILFSHSIVYLIHEKCSILFNFQHFFFYFTFSERIVFSLWTYQRYFFQFKTKDGKTINQSINSKKQKQKFTLELKGRTCVRIHDNNKDSTSNPLNYFQLTKTESSYICSSSIKLSKDKNASRVISTLTIDKYTGKLISFSNVGVIRVKKQFQCESLGPVIWKSFCIFILST